jgi:glycosyltransferase involved in cell wall biosynthesis
MIRAGMVTPNLSLGGAERWLVDIVKHSDPSRIRWEAVAVSGFGGADEDLVLELAEHVALYTNAAARTRPAHARSFYLKPFRLVPGAAFRDAIQTMVQNHNIQVLLTWGQVSLRQELGSLDIPRIVCSHTTSQEQTLRPASGVTHLASVSEAAAEYFKGRPGCEELPHRIIYNGADVSRCSPRRSREEVRRGWGVSPEQLVIGYLGRQSNEKNPMAAAEAAWTWPNACVVYYGYDGSGKQFDPALVDWCDEWLPGRWRMYPPVIHVGDVLQAFDVLVLASHREAFSMTLIEAWLTGLPVIATPVGSIPELERQYGQLVFPVPVSPSTQPLSQALKQTQQAELCQPIVEKAKQLACREFTAQAMVARWADYLEEAALDRVRAQEALVTEEVEQILSRLRTLYQLGAQAAQDDPGLRQRLTEDAAMRQEIMAFLDPRPAG